MMNIAVSPCDSSAQTSPSVPVTHCGCCRKDITAEEWERLEWIGDGEYDDVFDIEMRNHTCHSTLSILVTR